MRITPGSYSPTLRRSSPLIAGGPTRTCRWHAASCAGRTCAEISRRTLKGWPPRRSSARSVSSCASASSGRGRFTSTPASAASCRAASARYSGALQADHPHLRRQACPQQALPRHRQNLLKAWSALWTFAKHGGVQPTSNHTERALRSAVIYRKLSLGSQSEDGEQRIARLLSAHTTCRLQHRSLFAYLTDAITAHARGDPVPLLS